MMKLGLIGRNINYSLSGKIHDFALHSFGVKGSFTLFNLEEDELGVFLSNAWEEGMHGFSVTTPYKKTLAELLGNRELSAVNTLYRTSEGWASCSTDGAGFIRGLQRIDFQPQDFRRIVILGAGGVLPALLRCFADFAPEIYVLRRKSSGDEGLKALNPTLRFFDWQPSELCTLLKGAGSETLLIQASSAPLRGDSLVNFADAMKGFGGVFVDLVYGTPSHLFYQAQEMKLPCQDGLPMLIEQARLAQELWFDRSLSFESLWEHLAGVGS